MKTAEQIKGAIRNISKEKGVNPNSLLQMCLFEGILDKTYRQNKRIIVAVLCYFSLLDKKDKIMLKIS